MFYYLRITMREELIQEFTDLNSKIEKLKAILLDSEKLKEIDNLNKDLMVAQFKAMETYISVLSIRIGLSQDKGE